MGFTVYPAVDILGGRCVRLRRGDPLASKVYYEDPLEAVRRWVGEGAEALHVVDLDAALGRGQNTVLLSRLITAATVPVQLAGGIRDSAACAQAFEAGAARVVAGTAAVERPELIRTLADLYPGRVVVAADVRGREVAIEGWTRGSGQSVEDMLGALGTAAVAGLLVTDIDRDGVLGGPALELYAELASATEIPVIASGGVRDAADVAALAGTGAAGVVVGTALYEGRLSLSEVA